MRLQDFTLIEGAIVLAIIGMLLSIFIHKKLPDSYIIARLNNGHTVECTKWYRSNGSMNFTKCTDNMSYYSQTNVEILGRS